jgi:hypothetical protein
VLSAGLFKFYRTWAAYRDVHKALDRFYQRAGADRFATAGMAQMEIAAELCERVGQLPVAQDLKQRVQALEIEAQQAALFGKRGKRKAATALGAHPQKVEKATQAFAANGTDGGPRGGRKRKPGRPKGSKNKQTVTA